MLLFSLWKSNEELKIYEVKYKKIETQRANARKAIIAMMYSNSIVASKTLDTIYDSVGTSSLSLLYLAIISQESNYNQMAKSEYALGLMGINLVNMEELKKGKIVNELRDLYDIDTNIKAGKFIFNKYLKGPAKGNLNDALRDYVMGPNSKDKEKTEYNEKVLTTLGKFYLMTLDPEDE
jgi:hypothetical protein